MFVEHKNPQCLVPPKRLSASECNTGTLYWYSRPDGTIVHSINHLRLCTTEGMVLLDTGQKVEQRDGYFKLYIPVNPEEEFIIHNV